MSIGELEAGPRHRSCGTWEAHQRYLKEQPGYRSRYLEAEKLISAYLAHNEGAGFRAGVAVIPVVVHVVYNTAAQNISDAQIQSQLDVLNHDYRASNTDISGTPSAFASAEADARIEFRLAVRDPNCQTTTGITRTSTTVTQFDIFNTDAVKSAATGGADPWPADRYLNIWVCPGLSNQLGRGTFPGTAATVDGLIVVTQAFGTVGTLYSSYNLGRTATHEIGHYFDLHHLWGDVSDCSGTDFVADTPNQQSPNYGCQTFPHVTCTNGPNGDMFMNYMDYSDDRCMFMFTAGQVARMEAALVGPRASLLASDGLVPPPTPDVPSLWSADSPQDSGVEPDTASAALWQSDDIWVRNANDGIANQEHQNPIFGQTNYVYIRVRNRSCGSPGSATLRLYWAKASSALAWPAPWDGSVTTPALMGSQIGNQSTGSINGRDSRILTFTWNPPNPADYSMFGGDQNHFCLLSRIETSSTAPYGMTFPEGSNLAQNVGNNNKIAWKNVEVVSGGGRVGHFTVGNFGDGRRRFALSVVLPPREHFDKRDRVVLLFDPELTNQLQANGNTSIDSAGRLVLDNLGELVGPFELEQNENHTIAAELELHTAAQREATIIVLDAIQYGYGPRGRPYPIGGQRFVFRLLGRKKLSRPQAFAHWVHSHEEDEADAEVWRPHAFDFPPSRGRRELELGEDGSAAFYEIGAADGLRRLDGFWVAESDSLITLDFADPDLRRRTFSIVELGVDVLKLRRQ